MYTEPYLWTPVKFILLSDLQLKAQAPTTVKLAGQQEADFIIYTGDLVNTPGRVFDGFTVAQ
ncbi:MAG: metallophosphoesterase [Firmicutes bacterium]|nr:metallophosphoesterase [Bacillota bacterium]